MACLFTTFLAQYGDQAFDLAPPAETQQIAAVPTGDRPGGRGQPGPLAKIINQLRCIECALTISDEGMIAQC